MACHLYFLTPTSDNIYGRTAFGQQLSYTISQLLKDPRAIPNNSPPFFLPISVAPLRTNNMRSSVSLVICCGLLCTKRKFQFVFTCTWRGTRCSLSRAAAAVELSFCDLLRSCSCSLPHRVIQCTMIVFMLFHSSSS